MIYFLRHPCGFFFKQNFYLRFSCLAAVTWLQVLEHIIKFTKDDSSCYPILSSRRESDTGSGISRITEFSRYHLRWVLLFRVYRGGNWDTESRRDLSEIRLVPSPWADCKALLIPLHSPALDCVFNHRTLLPYAKMNIFSSVLLKRLCYLAWVSRGWHKTILA